MALWALMSTLLWCTGVLETNRTRPSFARGNKSRTKDRARWRVKEGVRPLREFAMHASGSRFALFATLFVIAWPAYSQESRIDLGVSLAIDAADGTPANEIPGAGV